MNTKKLLITTLAIVTLTFAHAEENYEETTSKFQITYNWQKHPAFNSSYAGLNSMSGAADKMYTFSLTAHLGTRLWSGGELYFNPEIA